MLFSETPVARRRATTDTACWRPGLDAEAAPVQLVLPRLEGDGELLRLVEVLIGLAVITA